MQSDKGDQLDNYISLASVVLVYYDYFVTFDDEVRFFWRRSRGPRRSWYRINAVTTLFFLNRYIPIVMNATIIAHDLGSMSTSVMMVVIVQLIVGMVTASRTYALYERSRAVWRLFVGFFVCGLGVGLWSVLDNRQEIQMIHVPARFGCQTALSDENGRSRYSLTYYDKPLVDQFFHYGFAGIAAPWIVLMVYDAAVFFLTLRKALQIWKLGSSRLFQILIRDGKEQHIHKLILADHGAGIGSIFFFVMTMANLSNVLVLILAPPFLKDVCTAFTSGISVTMISRLMLNIQNPILLEEPITRSYCGTLEVGTLVANLAEDDTQFITSTSWTVEGQ
ncbi:hypothetical protein ACEPAG_1853 [Sanghuangporus baumii]